MSKVRVEAYLTLQNFRNIEAVRTETKDKGYTRVLNHIISRYFESRIELEGKDMLIESLKQDLIRIKHPKKPEPTEENIPIAEKILEGKINENRIS